MGKKKKKGAKKVGVTSGSKKQSPLPVDVKVGILHTIADTIYSTPAGKIREAVANARDNDATWIIIVVDQTTKSLFIIDNGHGITETRFHDIFKSIGYGMLRNNSENKLSYFGLGLMSIFQLGREVEIFTRPKGQRDVLRLKVNTQEIFKKENENKSITSLDQFITLGRSDETTRADNSCALVNEKLAEKPLAGDLQTFTEIVIRQLSAGDLDTVCSSGFPEELRKLLPLEPDKNEPFLKRFTGQNSKRLRNILQTPKYCKTIDVHFGMQEEGETERLWKYFPSFRSDVSFPDDNTRIGETDEFAYYIVHSVAVDLQRGTDVDDTNRETGFWLRNQNFLVKSADFLERPGPGRKVKTIDQPLKAWVFGEIFHKDMNRFLTVSRNDFLFENAEFKDFQRQILDIVSPLNQGLRDIHRKKRQIVQDVIEPFRSFAAPDGTIEAIERRLRQTVGARTNQEESRKEILGRLRKVRNQTIERSEARIDVLLHQADRPIVLGDDKDAMVTIDPSRTMGSEDYDATWDSKHNRVVIAISPDLFKEREVVFMGETFKVSYVVAKEAAAGISFDVDAKRIYVNPFNEDLLKFRLSILDVYVALKVAEAISTTPKELVRHTLALLGTVSEVTTRYVTPLGDDLRRTLAVA